MGAATQVGTGFLKGLGVGVEGFAQFLLLADSIGAALGSRFPRLGSGEGRRLVSCSRSRSAGVSQSRPEDVTPCLEWPAHFKRSLAFWRGSTFGRFCLDIGSSPSGLVSFTTSRSASRAGTPAQCRTSPA